MSYVPSLSELHNRLENRPVYMFGAGNICDRSIDRLSVQPKGVVDNSGNLWGQSQRGVPISSPEVLVQDSPDAYIVICTTSHRDVADQLSDLGFREGEDFCVSPVLKDWIVIEDIDQSSASLLLTSGVSSSGRSSSKGGVYKLDICGHEYNIEHLFKGSAHGLIKVHDSYFYVDDDMGVVEIDRTFNRVRNGGFVAGSRGHGLGWSERYECFYMACSYLDQVIELNRDFSVKRKLSVSKKSGGPHHHVNDCCVIGDSLYVSMFSLTGNWKNGVFDGGVMEVDLISGEIVGPVAQGLSMPHNITSINGVLMVLDSLTGRFLGENMREFGKFSGFSRGLGCDGNYFFIGQSRNRNFSQQIGLSNNISIDSGVVVFDAERKLSKFIKLPEYITEIHSVLSIQ